MILIQDRCPRDTDFEIQKRPEDSLIHCLFMTQPSRCPFPLKETAYPERESNNLADLPRRSDVNAVSLDLVVKRLAADAQAFGGFEFVAAGFLQHLDNGVAFDAFEKGEVGVLSF